MWVVMVTDNYSEEGKAFRVGEERMVGVKELRKMYLEEVKNTYPINKEGTYIKDDYAQVSDYLRVKEFRLTELQGI